MKFGQRHVMAFFAHLGIMIIYIYRCNLSVAIVAMVNTTKADSFNTTNSEECQTNIENSTTPSSHQHGEFHWNEFDQGLLLGSFYWGYLCMQLPAGLLTQKFGGKWLFGFGILTTAILTFLTPFICRWGGFTALLITRIFEGFFEGVTLPAIYTLNGKWFPPLETTRLAGFVFMGAQFGNVIGLLATGTLCDADWLGGWSSSFYIFGLLGVLWFPLWAMFVYESADVHPHISDEEKHLLKAKSYLAYDKVPWLPIFTSPPVWAFVFAQFSAMWSMYTLLTCLPQYFEYILHFTISQNGLIMAVPNLLCVVVSFGAVFAADWLRTTGILSTTATRKVFTTFGFLFGGLCIFCVTLVGCSRVGSVSLLIICTAVSGLNMAGYGLNSLDLAPQYSGFIFSISNVFGTAAGFLGPLLVGYLTNQAETIPEWSIVFYITAGLDIMSIFIFLSFSSGEIQSWAQNNTVSCEDLLIQAES